MDASTLRELLDYDPESGEFTWRVSEGKRIKVGDKSGCPNWRGDVRIKIRGRFYLAHRLAWLHVHGEWPPHEIDHINGVRTDNRIANLRQATHQQNSCNKRRFSNNTSGVKGVTWHRHKQKWQAQIQSHGKNTYLGSFDRIEDAAEAYKRAAVTRHGAFVNLG